MPLELLAPEPHREALFAAIRREREQLRENRRRSYDELARILNELKTERAQAEVDDRRAQASFADAVVGATFDEAAAKTAAEQRRKSVELLQAQVVRALGRIHALLTPEQRSSLAYLIRTGTLTL